MPTTPTILFADSDTDFMNAMTHDLAAFGIPIQCVQTLDELLQQSKLSVWQLVIVHIFLSPSKPQDVFHFCKQFRLTDHKTPILVTGPSELTVFEWKLVERLNLYYVNQYEPTGKWIEKIETILNLSKTDDRLANSR